MESQLDRPVSAYDPARGLLNNEHFQMGYVTNDMAIAEEVFRKRFGVKEFRPTEGDLTAGGRISVRSAWIGSVMYEIICAAGPGSELYSDHVPEDDFAIRLHHFGFLVRKPDWAALECAIEEGGWDVPYRTDVPGFVRAVYVTSPELGHYLEFILPEQSFIERMNTTPVA